MGSQPNNRSTNEHPTNIQRSYDMRLLVLATLAAVSAARPQYGYSAPTTFDSVESVEVTPAPRGYAYPAARSLDSAESVEFIPILREESILEEDGTHNFEFESANGIVRSESGDSDGNKQGVIS